MILNTSEKLCVAFPALGSELEGLFILQNHDVSRFFHVFALQNHDLP